MRPLTGLLVALGLLVGEPAAGETPIDVQLRAGQAAGQVLLVVGDLKGQPLTEPVAAALHFLVQWAKRDPAVQTVPVIGAPFGRTSLKVLALGLPAADLVLVRETARSARIQVRTCTLTGLAGAACPVTLRLVRVAPEEAWYVLAVSLP